MVKREVNLISLPRLQPPFRCGILCAMKNKVKENNLMAFLE